MNNHPYNIPGYPYAPQYAYAYQHPYSQVPPYPPAAPYGMPAPMPAPMPNYAYYAPAPPPHETTSVYVPQHPPMSGYAPAMQYSQTRMATPTYPGYPPPAPQTPTYNYSTTNMISRAPRPASLYPQLNHVHAYPPPPNAQTHAPKLANNNNNNLPNVVKNENRDSVESKSSEAVRSYFYLLQLRVKL